MHVMLDLLIKNGLIVDGTGCKGYCADLGVKDGRIVQINKNINCEANEFIDADGLVVTPGFIDVHSHNDLVPFMEDRLKGLKLMQGVTTELVGQCGLGIVPCMESKNMLWKNYVRGVVGDTDEKWEFHDMHDYMKKISLRGLKNNYAALISHGAIKASVMGFDNSIPNGDQIRRMCEIAEDSMESGAFGMSVGLQYMPAIFSKKDELTAVCRVINKHNGILMVHLRNHDSSIINALDEILDIALASGVKLHISHMRSYNSKDLGCSAEKLINYMEKALKRGVSITFDEHLYLSGSTLMTQLFPPFVSDSGSNSMLDNLNNKRMLNRIKEELTDRSIRYAGWDNYSAVTGWDGILITSLKMEENKKYIGRSVGDISRELNMHPVDFAADLIVSEKGGVGIVTMNVFSEDDTDKLIRHPLQMVGSDSIPAGVPHPRLYGNFPLFFGKYVRQKKVLSLEEGVYKSTLLPAKTLGMKNAGELSVGKTADITIFNFDKVIGYEDYFNPAKAPEGIKYVIINGRLAVYDGRLCSKYNGRVIRYK
jgi:N-acyl-D-amino-acid deacylase